MGHGNELDKVLCHHQETGVALVQLWMNLERLWEAAPEEKWSNPILGNRTKNQPALEEENK